MESSCLSRRIRDIYYWIEMWEEVQVRKVMKEKERLETQANNSYRLSTQANGPLVILSVKVSERRKSIFNQLNNIVALS